MMGAHLLHLSLEDFVEAQYPEKHLQQMKYLFNFTQIVITPPIQVSNWITILKVSLIEQD
jgi:hypothetical protein